MSHTNQRIIGFITLLLALAIIMPAAESSTAGPESFEWFIKDAPPLAKASFKANTKGYWYPADTDWSEWSTGTRDNYASFCAIPIEQRGFYESVKCKGIGITKDKQVIGSNDIQQTREASENSFTEIEDVLARQLNHPPARPRRTILVNGKKGTDCYIAPGSRVYIKYKTPDHPYTGWYIAEDRSKSIEGTCTIKIFLGSGEQDKLNTPSPDAPSNPSEWPEIWVFPGEKDPYLWDESLISYLSGGPTSGRAIGEGGVPEAAYDESASAVRPMHPIFAVPYSVDPSFSVSMPYDFNIYDIVPKKIETLAECKNDIDCLLTKVSAIESETKLNWIVKYGGNVISKDEKGGLEYPAWELYCEKPDQHAVNSLAEAIDNCVKSSDKDCICEYTIPKVETDDTLTLLKEAVVGGISDFADFFGISSFADKAASGARWQERFIGLILKGADLRIFLTSKESGPLGADPKIVKGAYLQYVHSDLADQALATPEIKIKYPGQDPVLFRYDLSTRKWQFKVLWQSDVLFEWTGTIELDRTGWIDVEYMNNLFGEEYIDYVAIAIVLRTRTEDDGYKLFKYLEPKPEIKEGVPESALLSTILKYDRNTEGLDIYKAPQMGLEIHPKGSAPSKNLCRLNTKTLKFCVVQNNTFFAYNQQENKMGVQQMVLKFAYILTSGEANLGSFEVVDAKLATNTSLLIWDKIEGVDVVSYNIYYGTNPSIIATVKDKSPSGLDLNKLGIKKIELKLDSKDDVPVATESLYSPSCLVSEMTCKIGYAAGATESIDEGDFELDKNKFYYSGPAERFFYFLSGLENDKSYFFAVTATDKAGKETVFNTPASSEQSKDDLYPGIAKIASITISGENLVFGLDAFDYHIDGSTLDPDTIEQFKIYCFEDGVTEFNLENRAHVFASGISRGEDGSVRFSALLSDISASCGFTKTPKKARFIITGVKKVGVSPLDYNGWVTEKSLSEAAIDIP
ncbi:MAG: hypothetical protein V1729_01770 [Candidatus Woesearchaeota archaeon]